MHHATGVARAVSTVIGRATVAAGAPADPRRIRSRPVDGRRGIWRDCSGVCFAIGRRGAVSLILPASAVTRITRSNYILVAALATPRRRGKFHTARNARGGACLAVLTTCDVLSVDLASLLPLRVRPGSADSFERRPPPPRCVRRFCAAGVVDDDASRDGVRSPPSCGCPPVQSVRPSLVSLRRYAVGVDVADRALGLGDRSRCVVRRLRASRATGRAALAGVFHAVCDGDRRAAASARE